MNKTFSIKKLGSALAIGSLSLVLGCESVALLPRENIADRDRDRIAVDRDSRRDEIIGAVQNIDERSREIRLRTDDGRSAIVRYDGSTRISDRGGDLRPDALRSGDEVAVRVGRDSGGEPYADSIRVIDRRGS